jgi:cysteine desulfurase/selenocysteine lyase
MANKLPPYQGGGEMIETSAKTTCTGLHINLEAGTPNIWWNCFETVDYMNSVGFDNMQQQELELLRIWDKDDILEIEAYASCLLKRKPLLSFNIEGIHPYDIGTIIDKLDIAVR